MNNNIIVAAGVAIINKDGELLIAKRSPDKPMPNKWEFPGGKLEADETLEECAVREIKEELELDVQVDTYVGYEEILYKSKNFTLHLFTAHLNDESQALRLNEHTEARWVDFSDFDKYDLPANKLSFIKELKKQLER